MESNWRWRVADYGLSMGFFLKCARFLEPIGGVEAFLFAQTGGVYYGIGHHFPGSLPDYFIPVPLTGPFPGQYAELVEAD